MILNDLHSLPGIGRALPRVGASLALAVSLYGVGAGQLVHAQTPTSTEVVAEGARLPYIVCGIDTRLESGGHQSILLTNAGVPISPAQIDPAAIGQTFSIHGRSVTDCGAGFGFKGLGDRAANAGPVSMPANLTWLNGTRAGTTSEEMDALSCAFSSTEGCTLLVPVATGTDGAQLQAVLYALMEVNVTGLNAHSGRLLGDSSALSSPTP